MLMATPTPPVILVTLKTRVVDMARKLGNLTHFLEAAQALQTCNDIPSESFQKNSRKIVSLIEIARKTLTAAGIPLYLFVACSAVLSPFKAAYVDLLYMLKEHRHDIDTTLTARVQSLLTPLRSGFVIQRKGEPSNVVFTPGGRLQVPKTPPESQSLFSRPTKTPDFMPPPDAFPVLIDLSPRPPNGPPPVRRPIWGQEDTRPTLPPRRPKNLNTEQENIFSMPQPCGLVRPISRRFGIFCTGKNTMHQPPQDRGRVRTLRPAKE